MTERDPTPAEQVTLDPPAAPGPAETLPPESPADTGPASQVLTGVLPAPPADPGSQSQVLTAVFPAHLAKALGRFVIHECLGEGTFGTVYRAHDPRLDRTVALKVAKATVQSAERAERFRREARASAGLRHPHIVPLFETGEAIGQFYLVSAFVPGTTLEDALHERADASGFAPREAAEVVRKLAGALAYAHGQGVVHRDVKSANIVLDPQGDPHLLDFGLALRNETADRMTLDGSVLGTPAYLAPEVATGRRDLWGPATDQYALGVVLYELLTGQTPFSGPVEVVIALQQVTDPPPPRQHNPAVPRDLEAICLTCLEKDPAKRYPDCQALADDLRRWRDGESTLARPAGMAERAAKWARRNPAVAALSAAVVALFLVGFAGVTWQWYEAIHARQRAVSAEAEATSSAAAAQRSADAAEAVNRFLIIDLIKSANPEKALGRKITVEEILVNAAQRLGTKFAGQPTVEAAIRQALGNSFHSLGDYARAEPLLRDALAIHRRASGERDLETLGSKTDLAVLLYARSRLPEAEELFTQVLAARTELLGAAHPKTLESMNNLAALRHAQGRWTEARALYDQVLSERRQVLGPDHPDTLIALNNLAELLGSHDPAADAATMFKECVDGLRKAFGPAHPDTLKAMNNLAVHYYRKNDPEAAEPIFKDVLAARLKTFGPDHADTLQTRNDLAAILYRLGKLDEAEPMMRAALETRAKILGPTDPATLQTVNNLGVFLLAKRDFPAAAKLYGETAAACRDARGPDDPTARKYQELLALTQVQFADHLAGRRQADDAAAALKSAEDAGAKLASGHWLRLDMEGVRGGILMARDQLKDAEPLVRNAFEKLKDAAAPAARKQAARERLIRLYEATGRKDQADGLRVKPR